MYMCLSYNTLHPSISHKNHFSPIGELTTRMICTSFIGLPCRFVRILPLPSYNSFITYCTYDIQFFQIYMYLSTIFVFKQFLFSKITFLDFICVCSVTVPPPEVTVTPSPATGVFNQSVTLRCQIVSFTQTPNITWSTTANIKNLIQPLLVNGSEKGVFTSSLFLSNLTLESEGDYTCTAENGAGRGNDTSTLTVTGKMSERRLLVVGSAQ